MPFFTLSPDTFHTNTLHTLHTTSHTTLHRGYFTFCLLVPRDVTAHVLRGGHMLAMNVDSFDKDTRYVYTARGQGGGEGGRAGGRGPYRNRQ